ncbi:hypothetical protein KEM54_003647, partial [Ascosphaera aggregata]
MSEPGKRIGNGSQSQRVERPSLRPSSMAGGSFLRDHEQYKPATPAATPPAAPTLKSLLWAPRNRLYAPLPPNHQSPKLASSETGLVSLSQSPAPEAREQADSGKRPSGEVQSRQEIEQSEKAEDDPAKVTVTDSGIIHSIFSEYESLAAANSPKLIATMLYNGHKVGHKWNVGSSKEAQSTNAPEQAAPSKPAPQPKSLDSVSDLQPLDKYYGPFITQLCLASFLQLIDSMSTPYHRIHSSHRCLDISEDGDDDHPRVVEVTVSPPPIHPEYFTFADMRRHEDIHRFEETWNVQL